MITEDYVSFETAKLLNEKGFDCCRGDISAMYNEDGKFFSLSSAHEYSYEYTDFDYKDYIAPTLQMAIKWLREVHGVFIAINIVPNTTVTMEQRYYFFKPYKNRRIHNFPLDYSVQFYESYEEACEAAIKYCLINLI